MTSMEEQSSSELSDLLEKVHDRIGNPPGGLTIYTRLHWQQDRKLPISIQWRRSYNGILSDERQLEAQDLWTALKAVIAYEDDADAEDAENMSPSQLIRRDVAFDYAEAGEDDFMRLIEALEAALDETAERLEGLLKLGRGEA